MTAPWREWVQPGWWARHAWRFDVAFPALYACLYALAGFVLQVRLFPIGDIDVESDFYGDMVVAAQRLVAGHFSVADYPYKGPFYSIALAGVHLLVRDWYRSAVVLSALSAAGCLMLAYRLLLGLFGRRVAILSMLFLSLVSEFWVLSHRASTDVLFLLCALGSVTFFCLGRSLWSRGVAAGAIAALAFLTRYNGACLPAGALVALLAAGPPRTPWKEKLRAAAAYLGAFLLVSCPWLAASWTNAGQLLATKNLQNVIAGIYGGSRWENYPTRNLTDLRSLVAHDPIYFASQFGRNLADHARADMTQLVGFPVALLVMVGALRLFLVPPARAQWRLYAFALVYFVFLGVVFYHPRFFLFVAVAYAAIGADVFAGWGDRPRSRLGSWLETRQRRVANGWRAGAAPTMVARRALWIAPAALLAGLLASQACRIVAAERTLYDRRLLYVLDAAPALAQHAARTHQSTVMARKAHLAHYAGLTYVPYPRVTSSYEQLLQEARRRQADYLVFSSIEYQLVPGLRFMAVVDTMPGLHEIYRKRGMRIFEVSKQEAGAPLADKEKLEFLTANLAIATSNRDPKAIHLAWVDLGLHCMASGDLVRAADYFERAIQLGTGAPPGSEAALAQARDRHALAAVYFDLGKYAEGSALLQENLAFYTRWGNARDLAMTHESLAGYYRELGRPEAARHELREAYELFVKSGEKERAEALLRETGPPPAP